ncbi:hypothetical protein DL96DRAFT_842942 [Flagelloscypha sp. PMI_526]|nr:hypothetical protein DL96DRAFT_842942 [Flagelloscypha sp. PMI_526]
MITFVEKDKKKRLRVAMRLVVETWGPTAGSQRLRRLPLAGFLLLSCRSGKWCTSSSSSHVNVTHSSSENKVPCPGQHLPSFAVFSAAQQSFAGATHSNSPSTIDLDLKASFCHTPCFCHLGSQSVLALPARPEPLPSTLERRSTISSLPGHAFSSLHNGR